MATLCEDVEDQLCTPEANGQSVGNVVVRLNAISAGLRVGVGESMMIGWRELTKAAKWPDYVTLIARPRGDLSSDSRRPFLCMLHFVTRFHAVLYSQGICKTGYDLGGAIFHLTPGHRAHYCEARRPFQEAVPWPESAASASSKPSTQATVSAAGHKAG